MGLEFGMSREEIYNHINQGSYLVPAEDALMIQLIPETPYTLVLRSSYSNNNMIEKVFVDLYEETSYQYTVFLNPQYFSYYTLSEQLLDTYGVPKSRNSRQVIWQDDDNQVSLEYPSIVKYTYMPALIDVLRLQNREIETKANESVDYKERELILNDL